MKLLKQKARKTERTKKRYKAIVLGIFVLFVILNIVWFIGACSQYYMWHRKMIKEPGSINGDVIDDEGYCYSIHYPMYLGWGGNLSIAQSLDVLDDVDVDGKPLYVSHSSLIIWMKNFYEGVKEVGVILVQDGVSRQIYLEDNETARYADDQPYVDAGQEEINKLFRKAEEEWNIEMPWKN